jgi:hypothetical protein
MTEPSSSWIGPLAYEAANRSLDEQRTSLDELRNRTNILLSATVVATSFLAATAAKGRGKGFPPEFYWAVIPFALVIFLCVVILWPRRNWVFSLRPSDILDRADPSKPAAAFQSALARELEKRMLANSSRLNLRFLVFEAAAVAVLWEIVAWTVIIV